MKPIVFLFLLITSSAIAQDKMLPFYQIPAPADDFSAGSVASRVIDGLGFRFYWATEGLRTEDLSFKPNPEARTSEETLAHIYEMSILILNATTNTPNVPGQDKKLSFIEMRKTTLQNFKTASDRLRVCSDKQMKDLKVIFKENNQSAEFPFWNLINGPIEDCIWHTGQVVSFRRSSGNPFQEKVDLFSGTLSK